MEKINLNDYPKPWVKLYKSRDGSEKVYVAHHILSNEDRIIKKLEIPSINDIDDIYDKVITQVSVMPHPNVVSIIGRRCVEEVNPKTKERKIIMYIVMEKMEMSLKTEVQKRTKNSQPFTPAEQSRIASDLSAAASHFCHRGVQDIEIDASNIFVDKRGTHKLGIGREQATESGMEKIKNGTELQADKRMEVLAKHKLALERILKSVSCEVNQTKTGTLQPLRDVAMIRADIESFKKLDDDSKRKILGEILFPKVVAELGAAKAAHAPKITGMLMHFDVLEIEEILSMLENRDELLDGVREALELIEAHS
jgi:hypothetical protein